MASSRSQVDYILEQAGGPGAVSARAMFGEFALYREGKLVGLICDGQFFLKPTGAGRAMLGDPVEAPPYPGAKPCLVVPGERLDDGAWFAELMRVTAVELPAPKPRKREAPKMKTTAT